MKTHNRLHSLVNLPYALYSKWNCKLLSFIGFELNNNICNSDSDDMITKAFLFVFQNIKHNGDSPQTKMTFPLIRRRAKLE